jgi:hypothetical protein
MSNKDKPEKLKRKEYEKELRKLQVLSCAICRTGSRPPVGK